MLSTSLNKSVAQQIDRMVLYTMNRRLPDSFEHSHYDAPTLETVLAQTAVDLQKTPAYMLSAPGEHPIWLQTMDGPLKCQIRVRPAPDPQAPLILYHHGFNEVPYTNSWGRLFKRPLTTQAHTVCIQAPFHHHWNAPLKKGFVSLQSVYQIFAGSLRIMEAVQNQFEKQGAAYTIAAGISWGGITSLVYGGTFQRTRAVVPMLAAPNLAQVLWDIAQLFDRPIAIPYQQLHELLDFTAYYERCDANRVFPLMGENDLFFRFENHEPVFDGQHLTTIPAGHITAFWRMAPLRQHLRQVLTWANEQGEV